jgi:outer membrane protein assembly factor BamB
MRLITFLFLCLFAFFAANAQEAQWRGPERDGRFPDSGLLKIWPEAGPEMILKVEDLGMGYSSPVLHKGIIYITGKEDTLEYLSAVDLQGNIKYRVQYGSSWNQSFPEARSTPSIDGDRIYVISGMGEVACMKIDDGSLLWNVNANQRYQGELHRWGVAESPLIVDDKVIYTVGGKKTSVIALEKETGEEIWQTKGVGGTRTYVSPALYTHNDHQLIIAVTEFHILGINPEDGRMAWSMEFPLPEGTPARRGGIAPNTPVIKENEVFISKGYDMLGVMLKLGPDITDVKELWRTSVLDTHHGHYVLNDNYIYGSNWENNSQGNWVCLDWQTGEVQYEEKWNTKGSIAWADGKLYCYEERSGNVALVNPTPEKFDVVSTFKIEHGTGPHWAHPYISDKKLLIRHGKVLMVFDIAEKEG